ncbi:MAG: hypothetical protein SNJ84_04910 [Verrucomicrobiia bacterium]
MISPWILQTGLCFSLALIALGCLQSDRLTLRRLGLWLILATLLTALWFLFQHPLALILGLLLWFSLPIGQAIIISRRLRFGRHRSLQATAFPPDEFPDLPEASAELRALGFHELGDYWLPGAPLRQGYRLFCHPDHRTYGATAVVTTDGISLLYLIFISRAPKGSLWMTWDYPFTYALRTPPDLFVYRCLEADSIETLLHQHLAFLHANDLSPNHLLPADPSGAEPFFARIFTETLDYNLRIGLLRPQTPSGDPLRYSWRGTAYLSWQVLREMVLG